MNMVVVDTQPPHPRVEPRVEVAHIEGYNLLSDYLNMQIDFINSRD